MATALLVVLTVLGLVVLILAIALFVHLGTAQLRSPEAIAHDGPRPGRRAPAVDVTTIDGAPLIVPAGRRQILVFADHSLIDFEELLALLRSGDRADLPEVVVLGAHDQTSAELLSGLDLAVPTALVPHAIYGQYRVRVMPYAVVVGADGKVVTRGLVNTPFRLRHLAQVGTAATAGAAR